MKICRDHDLAIEVGGCPYCMQGIYPLRDLRAVRDFAMLPMPGTVDVPTYVPSIKYSEAVRRVGREALAIEAERLARCADLDLRYRQLRRDMKRARMDPAQMSRAVRVALGYAWEDHMLSPLAREYLSVISDDGIDW